MCGGRGTRLAAGEKPLFDVGGRPMVDRVVAALEASEVDEVLAVTSPHVPATAAHLDCPNLETPGEGYVADLQAALADDRVTRPVLTVAADLPLLDATIVDAVLDAAGGRSLAAAVPAGRVTGLGFSVDTTFRHRGVLVRPAGLNVVGDGDDRVWISRDRRLAANVNRPRDAAVAEWHLAGEGADGS
ncbi:NTP transferase domain-containing protein [Halobacteriales archaeon Cl-PHB]